MHRGTGIPQAYVDTAYVKDANGDVQVWRWYFSQLDCRGAGGGRVKDARGDHVAPVLVKNIVSFTHNGCSEQGDEGINGFFDADFVSLFYLFILSFLLLFSLPPVHEKKIFFFSLFSSISIIRAGWSFGLNGPCSVAYRPKII